MWTDFLEQVNDLMLEEKAARQVSDHVKLAEICLRIVSISILCINQILCDLASTCLWPKWIGKNERILPYSLQETWLGKETCCWNGWVDIEEAFW